MDVQFFLLQQFKLQMQTLVTLVCVCVLVGSDFMEVEVKDE